MRLTPTTLRSVAGLATAGLLAGGLMVHGASAATYACPTFTDPAGDAPITGGNPATGSNEDDIDLVAVTYTVSNNRFQAILKLAKLDTSPSSAATDIFRTTFTVDGKAASFTVQRDQFPTSTTTVTGTLDGKSVKPGVDVSTSASTVTISASVDDLVAAAGGPLTGKAFSAMKASTTASNSGVPVGTASDSAAAPDTASYLFGDTCTGQVDPTDEPTDEPTDTPTDEPSGDPSATPTDSADPSATPTDSGSPTATATGTPDGLAGYVGLPAPVRVLDTRGGSKRVGTVSGPVKGSFSFGVGDQVPDGATAVVLNVTATGGTTSGNLVVHRTGTPNPGTSSLNWSKGANQANEVTSAIDSAKSLDVDIRSAGTTHVVVDLVGYVSDNDANASTLALRTPPTRIFDKSVEDGPTRIAIPASLRPAGTKGALLNVTLVKPFTTAYLSVYPGDKSRTGTSTVNATSKEIQSNETFVALDSTGVFVVDLNVGVARVVVDLLGTYGDATSTSGTIVPREKPLRLLDTRSGLGGAKGRRTNGSDTKVVLPTDLPAGTIGVVLEVTTTQSTEGGYATVHPGSTSFNNTSTINLTKVSDRAHQVVVARGSGNPVITLGGNGATHLVADLVGYIVLPGSNASPTPDPSSTDEPTADPSATETPTDEPTADPSATATPTPSATATCRLTPPLC